MDIRLIIRNRLRGVKGRRRREGKPGGWKGQAKREGRGGVQEKPHPEVEARRGAAMQKLLDSSAEKSL
jgi:hypothetical protein